LLQQAFPGESTRKVGNWSGQIGAFALAMKVGDWVAVPSKMASTIAIGEIVSPCTYDAAAEPLFRHFRQIKWLNTEVPRSAFDQDILYSLGSVLTICEIKRNDAERRVRAMGQNGWRGSPAPAATLTQRSDKTEPALDDAEVDFEQLARDSIAKLIIQKFMGHGIARLVEAVLKAQGFTTHLSPPGADKGIDILAAGGAGREARQPAGVTTRPTAPGCRNVNRDGQVHGSTPARACSPFSPTASHGAAGSSRTTLRC
jgi:restriction system protein